MLDQDKRSCPALLISAPASGQGKTTVVAAIARFHRRQGRVVRVFKTGPDFIDPMIHRQASGQEVYQIDLWMVGEQQSRQLLYEAAQEADLILIEGVMGLFDGNPSSADLGIRFGLPVAAVIDASSMAQTFGAIAVGLAKYKPELEFAGVIANRIASEGHAKLLQQSVTEKVSWLAGLHRSENIALPERHLGLFQASDIDDLDRRLEIAADALIGSALSELPAAVDFYPGELKPLKSLPLAGRRIAVARDKAFSFLYQANLQALVTLGAEIVFFSPLQDSELPAADSLYFPGGYPELYLQELSANTVMKSAIKDHYQAGLNIVAECGGMMYLLESISNAQEEAFEMVGLISASATMQKKLGGLGLQWAEFPEGALRGHTFHYSVFNDDPPFEQRAEKYPYKTQGEGVIRSKGLLASYIHWYFPSNLTATAGLFLNQGGA